jgi:Na+/proline symporter
MRSEDYFLAGHHAPTWLVAVSVLSTVQSAATFLGVPDNSFRGDLHLPWRRAGRADSRVDRRQRADPALLCAEK